MANYTTNLNLEKPLQSEDYDVDVFNSNFDKIDNFAGQIPARALTADVLTTGAKINGVNFKGNADIVTGAGFYYDTVTYAQGDLAFIYNQNNGLELHKSLQNGNIGHNPLSTTGYWEKQDLGGSGGKDTGEIIKSTIPLTNAGLHLADGSRLSGDGIYKDFVEYMADLYTDNPTANYFCTEVEWQSAVSTNGVCGKYVYDSVNNTLRIPKLTGILEGTITANELGDTVQSSLPSITTTTNISVSVPVTGWGTTGNAPNSHTSITSGRLVVGSGYTETEETLESLRAGGNNRNANVTQGATSTYNTGKVQPQTVKVYYYIVVATSTKTTIEVDIDEIATDLNGKADVDLTNVNNQGKILMSRMGMPSGTYTSLTLGASGSDYTAPANGWVACQKVSGGTDKYLTIYNTTKWYGQTYYAPYSGGIAEVFLPVNKNDVFTINYDMTGTTNYLWFFYANGSESEAS